MDIQELQAIESQCTQEDMPFCQAACPLRVDVRAFLGHMAAGEIKAGRKILERSMPLVGILARICDHPCESACLRSAKGGSLAVGLLEQYCIEHSEPVLKPLVLPGKPRRAALLGGGLSALTVAAELSRKGYGITFFIPGERIGGRLHALLPSVLPPDVLAQELDKVLSRGARVETGQSLDLALLEKAGESFDAVYVDMSEATLGPGFSHHDADPLTLAVGPQGVFGGAWPGADNAFSPVREVADGRKAAISLDRYLSRVSLTVSREKEGTGSTRLFTNLADVAELPRVACTDMEDAQAGFSPEQAVAEAGRCLQCQCLECVKGCVFLQHYNIYPKSCARHIYNNLSIVQGNHTANTMINSCTLCGLCTEICPEDFSMADLCLKTRQRMVQSGNMPPSAHEFALEDMLFSNGPEFALFRAEPGRSSCAHVFFPGCQLGGEPESKIPEAYAFLREKLDGGVGLALGCCGIPALWAGQQHQFAAIVGAFRSQWESLGKPRVLAACSSCLSVFRQYAPDIPAVSLWRVFAEETGVPGDTGFTPRDTVAVHDPCTSRHDAFAQAAVRTVLDTCGAPFEELPLSGRFTECCGFGGLVGNAHPALAKDITARRAAASPLDYVTTCAMCRDRLVRSGKRSYHLLDILFEGPEEDPAARPDPGFSGRHEQRARLKRQMLASVWGEKQAPAPGPEYELLISPPVRDLLEQRHILTHEVALVVAQAQKTGQKFLDRNSDSFLACLRPRRVTYWVAYHMQENRAVIRNAYSHRMEITGVEGDPRQENVSMVYFPEQGDWVCAACGRPLLPASVRVSYMNGGFSVTLLSCRTCGGALLPDYLAMGKMFEVEQLMEDK